MKATLVITSVVLLLGVRAASARAECMCVAVAGDVSADVQADVAKADSLYARADFQGALQIYTDAYAKTKAAALLYAEAMCKWQLGMTADAQATFQAYLTTGDAEFKDRANAAVGAIGSGVKSAVDLTGGVAGGVAGGVEGGLGVASGVTAKPKRLAGGVAIVLGVVAAAAIVTVGYTGIHAAISDKVSFSSFDKGFAIGGGIAGVVMAGSAVYLWGLTAAAGTVGAACHAELPKKMIAPYAMEHGAGVTGIVRF